MTNSQAESLLRLVGSSFSHLDLNLIDIVRRTESPNAAEKAAEEGEYSLSIVKEMRQLAIIKRDQPAIFDELIPHLTSSLGGKGSSQRIFTCQWHAGEVVPGQEFGLEGTVKVSRHPLLPPLFWGYEIFDSSNRLLFSPDPSVQLKRLVPDPWSDGGPDYLTCLFTSGSKSLPVGLSLKGERRPCGFAERELVFCKKFGDTEVSWKHTIPESKEGGNELFEVYFSHHSSRISGESIHLRPLTTAEKPILAAYFQEDPWGLFISSKFFYPVGGGTGLFEVVTCYTLSSPWSRQDSKSFTAFKVDQFSFSKESWYKFNAYSGEKVFVKFQLLDGALRDSTQYETKPLGEMMEEIISGSPSTLNCSDVFWKLFGFKRDKYQIGIYGEFGALGYNKKEAA